MRWQDLRGSASLWLAAVSALVMLLVTAMPQLHDRWAVAGGFIPLRVDIAVEAPIALLPVWLTPLTSSFLHADWLHFLFNMLILLWCGRLVEEVIGKARLVLLYVVGAYAAATAHYFADPLSIVPVIGASGAISAIFGSYALTFGRPKQVTASPSVNRTIHAAWLLAFWVAIQWMIALVDQGLGYSIAVVAHVGGFAAGLLLLPLLRRRPQHDVEPS